jgi:hypothetical protein
VNENKQDRINQRAVMDDVLHWLQQLPLVGGNGKGFTCRERSTVAGESDVDFDIWWNHLCVGVAEIKCRTAEYEDWLINRDKLTMMYKRYQSNGIPALLVCAHVVDNLPVSIYAQDLRTLIAEKDQWKEAKPAMSASTNHGKDTRPEPQAAHLIPRDLFWKVL